MLVLTRKTDEEILIGDNIKITLVRVRGNSVRIGIEAPREVRIVRGELDVLDTPIETEVEIEADQSASKPVSSNRVSHLMDDADEPNASATKHSIFVGRIHRPENADRTTDAPLAGYMSPR